MKRFHTIAIIAVILAAIGGKANSQQLTLADKGTSRYTIAVAADAIPAEQNAASRLQHYLQEVTGATLPVVNETDAPANTPLILVGSGTRAKQLLPGQDWNALGNDGIVIKTVGENLILTGGRPRGALYAVYQFLEEEVSCRWWTAQARSIPRKATLTIAAQNTTYVPQFAYREHYTIPPARGEDDASHEFSVTLRNNGHFYRLPPQWGEHYSILGFVHTFTPLLPLSKYFKQHPEWYSDPKRGGLPSTSESEMPGVEHTQLCMSNDALRAEFIKNALEWVEKNPKAGYISISENDFGPYCKCPDCDAFAKREGSQSGPILNFVNHVADAIKEKAPHFWVETLAYHGSLKPPKTIRPRDNVIIRMAPIDSNYGQPLNSDANAPVRDNLKAWSEIAPRLFIWNYVTNFSASMMPHPNLGNWAKDLRFFAANKVEGIYQEGDYTTYAVGDFVHMRAWLMGKLMWNPQRDQNQLINEFLQGYYGPAAPHLKSYIDLMETSWQSEPRNLNTFNQNFSFLTLETMNQANRLFDQAQAAAAGDAELLQRIQRERLALQNAWIKRYPTLKLIAQGTGQPFEGPQNLQTAVDDFVAGAKQFGVKNYRLNQPFSVLENRLKKEATATVADTPEFLQTIDPSHVFDLQENVFKLWEEGTSVKIIDDADASNGKTAHVTGKGWHVELYLGEYKSFLPGHRWRSYARVKLKASDKPGKALTYGIHDYGTKKYVHSAALDSAQIDSGGYQWIDFGTYPLTPTSAFHFQKQEGAAELWVDRVVLVRE